jgi:hypothetical protein
MIARRVHYSRQRFSFVFQLPQLLIVINLVRDYSHQSPIVAYASRHRPDPHSLRKLSIGLPIADLMDSKLMVIKAMTNAMSPAKAKTNHPIETL